MGDKKEWLKADVEQLIYLYQCKPELWDITSEIYKDKLKKQNAYKELAEDFNTTVEEIQRKIHNLRTQFNNEVKKLNKTKSGQSTGEVFKWPYYKSLLFLQGGLICRPAKRNFAMKTEVNEATNEMNTSSDIQGTSQPEKGNRSYLTSVWQDNEINIKKARRTEISKDDLLIQKGIRTLNEEEDQYDIFGKYVASEMRSLSSEYLRKKMKRKFQQVILEINMEDELLSSPSSSHSPRSVASAGIDILNPQVILDKM
ncbi:uncharacterized protein LOC114327031 [Diabrotica virgifera virgifera]|uniref:Uncharacterized protein LOC114327031 n=1 Tax=Diabrotica virgifera virgifera TaxID=50390 RepID=A0A6P7F764_DIAVI|nr:uncharacterized protein LOC114327031 [Diabrotica virgifera virgifera]